MANPALGSQGSFWAKPTHKWLHCELWSSGLASLPLANDSGTQRANCTQMSLEVTLALTGSPCGSVCPLPYSLIITPLNTPLACPHRPHSLPITSPPRPKLQSSFAL